MNHVPADNRHERRNQQRNQYLRIHSLEALHSSPWRWLMAICARCLACAAGRRCSRRTRKRLRELGDCDRTGGGEGLAVGLDAFDLVQRFRGKISLSAVGTTDHRNVLDDQQILASSVGFSHVADTHTRLSTDVTSSFAIMFLHSA